MREPTGYWARCETPYSQLPTEGLKFMASALPDQPDAPPCEEDRDLDFRRRYAAILLAERGR